MILKRLDTKTVPNFRSVNETFLFVSQPRKPPEAMAMERKNRTRGEEEEETERRSEVKALRRFHNHVKSHLIQTYCSPRKSGAVILEVCAGKAGDAWKWASVRPKHVFAVDINTSYLTEARRRIAQMGKRSPLCDRVSFIQTDLREATAFSEALVGISPGSVDLVSCQFALHYFFGAREILTRLISWISGRLRPGGYFIGTLVNGERVYQLVDSKTLQYHSKVLSIRLNGGKQQRKDDIKGSVMEEEKLKMREDFGQNVNMTLHDTIIGGEGSAEYMVFPFVLRRVMEDCGLVYVDHTDFADWHKNYCTLYAKAHAGSSLDLSKDEQEASFLNMSFVYQRPPGSMFEECKKKPVSVYPVCPLKNTPITCTGRAIFLSRFVTGGGGAGGAAASSDFRLRISSPAEGGSSSRIPILRWHFPQMSLSL